MDYHDFRGEIIQTPWATLDRMLGDLGGRPVDWMQLESSRRRVEWMQADAATHLLVARMSVTSFWAGGRTLEGPTHHNGLLELTWMEQGRVELTLGGRRVEASAGACLLIPADIEHTPRFHSAVAHQVRFSSQWLEAAAEQLERPFPPVAEPRVFGAEQSLPRLVGVLAERLNQGLSTDDPEVSALSDALTFCLVRGPPPAQERGPDAGIRRALDLMNSSFGEPLTVEELAQAAGLPRFAFLRRFRAQVGTSPYRALTELRLERSAELLRNSSASILEVCLSCGFGDPSRFARMFRQRYGCTPRRFRGEQRPAAHETPIGRTNR